MNIFSAFAAGSAAAVSLLFSGCGSSSDARVTQNSDGNYVAECSSECRIIGRGVSYEVCLKVTTDNTGSILSVEDNGTEIRDGEDGEYKMAEVLFADLAGKNADTFREVDTVSGATVSSDSILDAVEQGLDAIGESIDEKNAAER